MEPSKRLNTPTSTRGYEQRFVSIALSLQIASPPLLDAETRPCSIDRFVGVPDVSLPYLFSSCNFRGANIPISAVCIKFVASTNVPWQLTTPRILERRDTLT